MISVDLAGDLAPDKVACIVMSRGWVKTKMSGWTGPMETDEAVNRLIKVINGLGFSDTEAFYHRDGRKVGH